MNNQELEGWLLRLATQRARLFIGSLAALLHVEYRDIKRAVRALKCEGALVDSPKRGYSFGYRDALAQYIHDHEPASRARIASRFGVAVLDPVLTDLVEQYRITAGPDGYRTYGPELATICMPASNSTPTYPLIMSQGLSRNGLLS